MQIEALHEFIDCLHTKVFEPVYPIIKMAWCSPFNCYQPIVIIITMISLWVRRMVILGLLSYFFWMHLSSPPYLRYHLSYARPLCMVIDWMVYRMKKFRASAPQHYTHISKHGKSSAKLYPAVNVLSKVHLVLCSGKS